MPAIRNTRSSWATCADQRRQKSARATYGGTHASSSKTQHETESDPEDDAAAPSSARATHVSPSRETLASGFGAIEPFRSAARTNANTGTSTNNATNFTARTAATIRGFSRTLAEATARSLATSRISRRQRYIAKTYASARRIAAGLAHPGTALPSSPNATRAKAATTSAVFAATMA